MPPLETIARPVWRTERRIGLIALRGYLAVAVALVIFKTATLALG